VSLSPAGSAAALLLCLPILIAAWVVLCLIP
jgi:hypothetical protein